MSHSQRMWQRKGARKRTIITVASMYVSCLFYFLFQGGKTSVMLLAMVTVLLVYWGVVLVGGIRNVRGTRMLGDGSGVFFPANSQLYVNIRVTVPGWLPIPYLVVRDELCRFGNRCNTMESAVVLGAGRSATVTYRTPSLARGYYEFAPALCSSKDLFGLFEQSGSLNAPSAFYVMPTVIPIPRWTHAERQVGHGVHAASSVRHHRESSQQNGVREYVYGDKLSRIHWNATAKTGILKTRQFDPESQSPIIVVLDCRSLSYEGNKAVADEKFEAAVSTMASLVQYGAQCQRPTYVAAIGERLNWWTADQAKPEIAVFRQWMSTVQLESSEEQEQQLAALTEHASMLHGASLAFISGHASSDVLIYTRTLSKLGCSGSFIHVKEEVSAPHNERSQSLVRLLASQRLHYISLSQVQDLPKLLGGGAA
jgi:uncharacterized protein (DUF58 family)